MSGIYFHIPFCKQACSYCDFHFSVSLKRKADVLHAMAKELEWRADFLPEKQLKTIYFGGGTPSLLTASELLTLFDQMNQHFDLSEVTEITLEANPDDLTKAYLKELSATPINRLSIGVQSFREDDLALMKRAHTSSQAESAIKGAQDVGFDNLSCDLIFGMPKLTKEDLAFNVGQLVGMHVPHISAYALTIEERTQLHLLAQKGKFKPAPDQHYKEQMFYLIEALGQLGYEHYELSNYAKDGRYAVHNSSYWQSVPYLGIGPSAHSYDGVSKRLWNVSSNTGYTQSILKEKRTNYDVEVLNQFNQINEAILVGLRTKWGINTASFEDRFGSKALIQLNKAVQQFIDKGMIQESREAYVLTKEGKIMADYIMSELFIVA